MTSLSSLISCPKCSNVLSYFDYVSHIELCKNSHNSNNDTSCELSEYEGIESSNDDEHENEDDDDDEDYNYDTYDTYDTNDNDNDIEIPITNSSSNVSSNPSTNSLNLYNPMLDRGFNDYNTSPIDYITNQLSTFDFNSNYDCEFDSGIGIENLYLYSSRLPVISESYCIICMNTYEIGSEFYLIKCMHSFCVECGDKWFDIKSFCPLCKTNLRN